MANVLLDHVAAKVEEALAALGVQGFDVREVIEIPPGRELGDYAFPCFQLARVLRKAPDRIAEELGQRIGPTELIERVEVVKAYVNIFLNRDESSRRVVEAVLAHGDDYGKSDVGNGKTVVLDFSSPNIAKPFHVGHLRSTIIGHSLARIFESLGFKTVRDQPPRRLGHPVRQADRGVPPLGRPGAP